MKNFENKCPVCLNRSNLSHFNWGNYPIIHCENCGLDYCSQMVEKESGGDSSPVHMEGIEMMGNSFHKTDELAKKYTQKLLDKGMLKYLIG